MSFNARHIRLACAAMLWTTILPLYLHADLNFGLVSHINFDTDNFSSSPVTDGTGSWISFQDKSGQGNPATCYRNVTLSGVNYPMDQCPQSSTGPDGSKAAEFYGNLCDVQSDHLGIANSPELTNLPQGTIALWVLYHENDIYGGTKPYRNSRLLDTYKHNTPGTWYLGRNGTSSNIFKANTTVGTEQLIFSFPDSNLYSREYETWNHLAITWDGETISGYFNGTLFTQVSQKEFPTFNLGTYITIGALNHSDPRNSKDNNCVTYYNGDPAKTYVQPNAGFLNGKIDDIRIYNRNLSPSEISQLATAAGKRPTKLLRVEKSGTGYGYVTSSRSGINCGSYCWETYAPGTSLTLTATPRADSMFFGWGGACSGLGTCNITLNNDVTVTANFQSTTEEIASFKAADGALTFPFVVLNGRVLQQGNAIATPVNGGRAEYTFSLSEPADIMVAATVNAPNTGSDSFFVNIDTLPSDPHMIWDIGSTIGLENRLVRLRGNGTDDRPQYDPMIWSLGSGEHKVIVVARESKTELHSLSILKKGTATKPQAPTNLYVYECIQFYGFEFRWTDNSTNETGFILEHSLDGVNFSAVSTASANAVTIAHGVKNKQHVWYRLRAVNGAGLSEPSNTITFATLWQPLYFVLSTTDTNKATIEFFDRSDEEMGYQIERSDDGGKTYKIVTKRLTSEFAVIPGDHGSPDRTKVFEDNSGGAGLPLGINYFYRVAAYNEIGLSPYAAPGVLTIGPGLPPLAPGLTAALTQFSSNKLTPTEVRLVIDDRSNNEKRFEIERSQNGTTWIQLGGINFSAGEKVFYDRNNIQPGQTYWYRAYASNAIGKSNFTSLAEPIRVPGLPPSGVTQWYVWKDAPGGATGESWSQAWKDLDQINWTAIKPGDTIYISGGQYTKPFNIFSSGTAEKPVLIRPGSAAPNPDGHQSKVIVPKIYIGPRINWVTVDGSFDPHFIPATAEAVISNINFESHNSPDHGIFATNPVGISIRFVEVSNAEQSGIVFSAKGMDYIDIYGCYVHHVKQVGIATGYPSPRPVYDAIKIQKSLVEYTGDDMIQCSGNITISDNILRYLYPGGSSGHADVIQTVEASYLLIKNNVMYDRSKSSYFIITGGARTGTHGHWRIFNNLFYYSSPNSAPPTSGILFSGTADYESDKVVDEMTFDDVVVANNSFINMPHFLSFNRRDGVQRVNIRNVLIQNNLIYNQGSVSLKGNPESGLYYDLSTVRFDNNVFSGTGTKVEVNGTYYLSVAALNDTGLFGKNYSATPQFINFANSQYDLDPNDGAAKDKGISLGDLFNYDLRGTNRPQGAAWDIGALEAPGDGGGIDSTSPIRAQLAPVGIFSANTKEMTLSLATNELAHCRYSDKPGTSFSLMPFDFSPQWGTNHSARITTLSSGKSYSFYIRCQDQTGNTNNNDVVIQFSIASSNTGAENPSKPAENSEMSAFLPGKNVFNLTNDTVIILRYSGQIAFSATIYDRYGNEIRRLAPGNIVDFFIETTWDGRNSSGQKVAAGIYHAIFKTPANELKRTIVVVK